MTMISLVLALTQAAAPGPCARAAGEYGFGTGFVGERITIAADCSYNSSYGTDNFVRVSTNGSVSLDLDTITLRASRVDATRLKEVDGKLSTQADESLANQYRVRTLAFVTWEGLNLLFEVRARRRVCDAIRDGHLLLDWAYVDVRRLDDVLGRLRDPRRNESPPKWCTTAK